MEAFYTNTAHALLLAWLPPSPTEAFVPKNTNAGGNTATSRGETIPGDSNSNPPHSLRQALLPFAFNLTSLELHSFSAKDLKAISMR